MKAFIFGTGSTADRLLPQIRKEYEVIGFLDNDKSKWNTSFEGLSVYPPDYILQADYDSIIIATTTGLNPITKQLLDMGIDRGKIITDYVVVFVKSRIIFLEELGELFLEKGLSGCVAEGGVFQGEFAREINRVFPSKTFYLFDTFTGFDERDVQEDKKLEYSRHNEGFLNITNEEIVLRKLPHPDKCIIRKGFFPETAIGIDENETFCFVNLDFDLYQPILAGLEFFAPRMVKGGVILVHDYFNKGFKGVKQAIIDFDTDKRGLSLFPIGDGYSIGIQF